MTVPAATSARRTGEAGTTEEQAFTTVAGRVVFTARFLPATSPRRVWVVAHSIGHETTSLEHHEVLACRAAARAGDAAWYVQMPGYGDSPGEHTLDDPHGRAELLAAAADVARAETGAPGAALLGSSFGGAVALLAAAQTGSLRALALWAPALDLRAAFRAYMRTRLVASVVGRKEMSDTDGYLDLVGYALAANLPERAATISVADAPLPALEDVFLLTIGTGERSAAAAALEARLAGAGARVLAQHIDGTPGWHNHSPAFFVAPGPAARFAAWLGVG